MRNRMESNEMKQNCIDVLEEYAMVEAIHQMEESLTKSQGEQAIAVRAVRRLIDCGLDEPIDMAAQ
eukprot:scaffold81587_cov37-Prasinocladus_malaysianus.AAC.1